MKKLSAVGLAMTLGCLRVRPCVGRRKSVP
jgi:hypothetical protein